MFITLGTVEAAGFKMCGVGFFFFFLSIFKKNDENIFNLSSKT